MTIIIEYFGIQFVIYTNDHLPPHVHIRYGENVMKAIFIFKDGRLKTIDYIVIAGKFSPTKTNEIKNIVEVFAEYIYVSWERIVIKGINPNDVRLIINIRAKSKEVLKQNEMKIYENSVKKNKKL